MSRHREDREEESNAERRTPNTRVAPPALEFAIVNQALPDAVIFTGAPNDLSVTFGNPHSASGSWSLKGGSAVPSQESFDPEAGELSVFYLSWPATAGIQVPSDGVRAPEGWIAQVFETGLNAPYAGFMPVSDIGLAPGESISVEIAGITAAAGQLQSANFELDAFQLVRAGHDSDRSETVTMKLEPRPVNGKRELDLTVRFIDGSRVLLTPPGQTAIHTRLTLEIRNNGSEPLIAAKAHPQQPGRIELGFSAGPDPERGVLASPGDIQSFPLPTFQESESSKWRASRANTADTHFAVEPILAENPEMLAPGEYLVIRLDGLFSHNAVDHDSTRLAVRVGQLDGYEAKSFDVEIDKLYPDGILGLDVDRNEIAPGESVELRWLIAGVEQESVTLEGLPEGTLTGQQVEFVGYSQVRLDASATFTLSTTASVDDRRKSLVQSVTVFPPAIRKFTGRIARDAAGVAIILEWDTEYAIGASLNGVAVEPGQQTREIRIGTDQPFAGSYTLRITAKSGETVSSTLEFAWREIAPRVHPGPVAVESLNHILPVLHTGGRSAITLQGVTGKVSITASDSAMAMNVENLFYTRATSTMASSADGRVLASVGITGDPDRGRRGELTALCCLDDVCSSAELWPDFKSAAWCAVTGDAKWLLTGPVPGPRPRVTEAGVASFRIVGVNAERCVLFPDDRGGVGINREAVESFYFFDFGPGPAGEPVSLPAPVTCAAVSADGLRLYCGDVNGRIHRLDIDPDTRQLAISGGAPLLVSDQQLLAIVAPASGTHLIASDARGVYFVSLEFFQPSAVFSHVDAAGPALGMIPEILSIVVQAPDGFALLTPAFTGGIEG